jgi:hypothetical protein
VFLPVGLDRYDLATKRFKIYPSSQFISAKRLEVSRNSNSRRICDREIVPNYARNFILAFNRPFTLTEIPMSEDVAQEIIDFAEQDVKKLQGGENFEFKDLSPFGRTVFLRLKVSMVQYKEMGKNYSDEWVPVIFSTIDGYQIFMHRDRKITIYDQEVENKRKMDRLKKSSAGERVTLPDGPFLQESQAPEEPLVPVSPE